MKNMMTSFQKNIDRRKGFILPFTMLITTLILFIVTGTMTLLSKQMYFSRLYKQSQVAYYSADDAISCALSIDDTYVGDDGLGIFPSSSVPDVSGSDSLTYMSDVLTQLKNKDPIFLLLTSLNDIKCAQATIFDPASPSSFSVSPTNYQYHYFNATNSQPEIEEGKSVSYFMKMPLDTLNYRCAKVTINKTQSFRQIISQGYASCDITSGSVERAVVNETIAQ
jgi:hypothetical protein